MFQQIDASDLYSDDKYKIIADEVYTGIFKGECWHNTKFFIFDKVCGCPRYFLNPLFISQKDRSTLFFETC